MTGLVFTGSDNGVRTRDPHLGKVVLYQLSHVRVAKSYISGTVIRVQELFFMLALLHKTNRCVWFYGKPS